MQTATNSRRSPITLAIADVNLMAGRLLSDQFKRYSEIAVVSCTADKNSLLKSVREAKPNVAIIGADLQDGARAASTRCENFMRPSPTCVQSSCSIGLSRRSWSRACVRVREESFRDPTSILRRFASASVGYLGATLD